MFGFRITAIKPLTALSVFYNICVIANARTDTENPYDQEHFLKTYFSMIQPVLMSIISGCSCFLLCWTINYFNWLKIGEFPSSPSILSSPGASHADTLHASKSEFAYATPVFVSVVTAGILLLS